MNRKSNLLITAIRNLTPLLFTVSLWLASASTAFGYGALTHQATIDAVWEDTFQPLLQKRFPTATDKDLRAARAYAYGGSIIQDLGYYTTRGHKLSILG